MGNIEKTQGGCDELKFRFEKDFCRKQRKHTAKSNFKSSAGKVRVYNALRQAKNKKS